MSDLNLLRYDYVDLSQHIPRNQQPSVVKIARPKPESSPPLNVGIFTLRGRIAWTLQVAEQHLREELGHRYASGDTREGFAVDAAVRYLVPRVDELASMQARTAAWDQQYAPFEMDGVQVLALFNALHRASRLACGMEVRLVAMPGFCPQCGATRLRRDPADDAQWIRCGGCKLQLTPADYFEAIRLRLPVTDGDGGALSAQE